MCHPEAVTITAGELAETLIESFVADRAVLLRACEDVMGLLARPGEARSVPGSAIEAILAPAIERARYGPR